LIFFYEKEIWRIWAIFSMRNTLYTGQNNILKVKFGENSQLTKTLVLCRIYHSLTVFHIDPKKKEKTEKNKS